ncbi:tyrosine phosphatase [Blastomyces gilchristii SLH14081]|uniref:Tyrosine phosphatase n=1 Tax=Blastomyces gilchristii (strain SLH14081) TaxID=559298 RepID=A0A179UH46_BLAGS|nr:tyrosine phosphatase [Blastomyces gilchristii SLH14081]OAT06447.1 tyrosine phosphatase [Blastomyces gilchristii SLH14081]
MDTSLVASKADQAAHPRHMELDYQKTSLKSSKAYTEAVFLYQCISTLFPGLILRPLFDEEWSRDYGEFIQENGIKSYVIPILANKNPLVFTPYETVIEVLMLILNPMNHPVLIHCNKGKHRTGCVIACFRRVQGWSLMAALQEYQKHSTPKSRVLDRNYIEGFDPNSLSDLVEKVGARKWLPTIIPVDNIGKDRREISQISHDEDQIPKAESAPPSHFNTSLEELHRINSI